MIGNTGIKVSQALALACFVVAGVVLVINYVKCAKKGWPAVEMSGAGSQPVETGGAKKQSVEDSGAESQSVETGGAEKPETHEKSGENKKK